MATGPGCADADVLSRLIFLTGQIDDVIDMPGREGDLADLADRMEVPGGIPRLAETVDIFKAQVARREKRTVASMGRLETASKLIRAQASQFLSASLAQCMIAALNTNNPPAPPPASRR